MKCNACRREVTKLDLRNLCKHCGWQIDHIDAIACDIEGIHNDMRQSGIPLGKKGKGQSRERDDD